MSVNGTLVEAKTCSFTLESSHFIYNKCSIYSHDGASAKFSTNSHETDYRAASILVDRKYRDLFLISEALYSQVGNYPPLSSVLCGIISGRRSVLAA